MSLQAKLMITALLFGNAVLVLELLRKRKLTESYTLLWLFVVLGTTLFTWADGLLLRMTRFFGALVPVSTLTFLSLAFILMMLIFFSMKISKLGKELKDLAQQVALRTPEPPAAGGSDREGTGRDAETPAPVASSTNPGKSPHTPAP